jgi:PAS domain S-box-containing protein
MIVGDVIAVLQLHRVETRAWRFYQADQKSLAILHVYLDVVTFRDTLTGLAHDQNPHEFASRANALRDNFLRDVTQAQRTLSSSPDASQDPTILIRLETVKAALPSQVDTFLDLVKVEDWQAVRFRLAGQVQPLIAISSSLVADVEQEVAQERAQALENIQRTRRQLYLVLPVTALLILLMAAMLGWYATRRISRPLAQLDAGAQALARGEFGYEVELTGNDELSDLARAFNDAAHQLHKFYDDIKRSEAYLAESNAKLEEAQRITHVGYWEWDPLTDRVNWSDETYRIYGMRPQERPMDLATVQEKIHPEDWKRAMEQALGGARINVECRLFRPTGEVRIVQFQGDVKRDTSGQPTLRFGTVQDITDRKRGEEQLRRSQFYLSEGQRLAQMGSWAFNPAGFFDYWSEDLFRIYGLDPQKGAPTLGQYLATVHPADRDFMADTIKRMHVEHSGCDVKKRIVCPDGKLRYIRCVGIPVVQGDVLKGFLGTAIDITEQELLTRELERRQAYLAEAQRLTHTGSWAWNVGTDDLFWSEEIFRIYEVDPVKLKPAWSLILDRVHPDDRASLLQRKKMESTQTKWAEAEADFRIIVPDGRIKHLHSISHPVMDASGQIIEVIGTVMDVTERKRVEDSLRRSESHLAEAQKLTHTGSWAWRVPDWNVVEVSEEFYRIFGFDPAEGAPTREEYLERVHPEDRLKWTGITERAIVQKADYDHEFRILLPNGKVKWIHTVGHPVVSNAGDLEQFVGSSTDITELKSAEQEHEKLRQLEADLAHIDRVSTLGEMAASLAHEIKQPIAAAITSANTCIEWLAHEPPNLDRARAAAARIDKYGNRAAEIIDRIRSFYRKSPPRRELIDVNGIVQEMLTLLNGEATRYSVAMGTELAAELPKITADRVQLQQVFMNLMLNAIEAMKDSGGELTVKSQLRVGQLQFSVSDTGVGLPMEKMDQIFSAFFTTKPQGSGMGLAISRSIVESHGGQLWARANDGRGATFHFTLPLQVTESSPLVA